MAGQLTTYSEISALNYLFKNKTIYLELMELDVLYILQDNVTLTEAQTKYKPADPAYQPQIITFSEPFQGQYGTTISNANEIIFPTWTTTQTVKYIIGAYIHDGTNILASFAFGHANGDQDGKVFATAGQIFYVRIGELNITLE